MKVPVSVKPARTKRAKLPAWVATSRRQLTPAFLTLFYRHGAAPANVEATAQIVLRAMWAHVLACEAAARPEFAAEVRQRVEAAGR